MPGYRVNMLSLLLVFHISEWHNDDQDSKFIHSLFIITTGVLHINESYKVVETHTALRNKLPTHTYSATDHIYSAQTHTALQYVNCTLVNLWLGNIYVCSVMTTNYFEYILTDISLMSNTIISVTDVSWATGLLLAILSFGLKFCGFLGYKN
jgi:hypothetical protein